MRPSAFLLACLLTVGTAFAESPRVMTWIPPYAITLSQKRLAQLTQGAGPSKALTDLALQFWKPTGAGGLVRESAYGTITDEQITTLAAWAHQHGIRLLLCVYNGGETWDWTLARSAFADHRTAFVTALLAEVNRLGLDGVDVDFEGDAQLDDDHAPFVQFISDLASSLHSASHVLTVDSFPTIWNAPNVNWWPDLLPLVDGLTAMGYNDTGRHAKGWRSYAQLRASAGDHARKLLIGVPSDSASWRGDTAVDQVEWMRAHSVGVSIWDAQLPSPAWRKPFLWRQLQKMRAAQ